MNRTARLALVWVLALGAGCSHVLSPPAHVINAESAAPVKPGETVLGARGAAIGELFGSGVALLGGGLRRGVAEDVELNGEATYGRVDPTDATLSSDARNAAAAHVGVKAGNKAAAVVGGVGGGYVGATGGFVAADAGFIVSAANCYVVPFFSPTAFLSVPIGAKTVTFTNGDTSRPGTTYGFGISGGIEIPLDRSRCREGRTPPRLQLGANVYEAWSHDQSSTGGGIQPQDSYPSSHGGVALAVGIEFPL